MPFSAQRLPVAVVGMGLSGQAAMRLLAARGVPAASVATFDTAPGRAQFSDPQKLLRDFAPRCLIVSPGVPLQTPWIRSFVENGGELSSELALACESLEGEKVVAVTGSLGKSTTVSLLGAGLGAWGVPHFVGGNIGDPLANYVADVMEGRRPRAQWLLLELSSYQLENCGDLRLDGAAITYLTGNHLDRYPSLEAYYETKWELVRRSEGPLVMNLKGGDLAAFAARKDEAPRLSWASADKSELSPAEMARSPLIGAHNRDNVAVAAGLARALGWPKAAFDGMLAFAGLPHRVFSLGARRGIHFVDDSKATTIESVRTAVRSVQDSLKPRRLWLLLGGRDKKLPWHELAALKTESQLHPVFFGECRAEAQKQSGLAGPAFGRLSEALQHLKGAAAAGDAVLLSPGGSSLDEFRNFEERGLAFAQYVRQTFEE